MLKVEFTFFPFKPLERGKKEGTLRVDSLLDIAVNKAFTISQQPRARDFVDVFFILKNTKWEFFNLIRDVRLKFDTHIDLIQLGTNLLKVKDRKDMPRMRAPLNKKEIEDFFLKAVSDVKKKLLTD